MVTQAREDVTDRTHDGDLAIEVSGLTKSYGHIEAVRGIDFNVKKGEVFAMLGPNGAGKTTTVEILEGHRPRSTGDIKVLGFDPAHGDRELKRRIGIVLQETGVQPYLTVAEAIELYRGYYANPLEVDDILRLVGLEHKHKERVNKLSGGQKRRLDVAIGLAGNPELLFLDEPTTGFDPSARRNAWQMIANLQKLGTTVFLTTHYMDEAQRLADRAAIIVKGKIVAMGPPGALSRGKSGATTVTFRLADGAAPLPDGLRAHATLTDDRVTMETDRPISLLHELTGWGLQQDTELLELSVSRPSLEDVYLQLTDDAETQPNE